MYLNVRMLDFWLVQLLSDSLHARLHPIAFFPLRWRTDSHGFLASGLCRLVGIVLLVTLQEFPLQWLSWVLS